MCARLRARARVRDYDGVEAAKVPAHVRDLVRAGRGGPIYIYIYIYTLKDSFSPTD